jgi:hypothetical protein
MAIIPASSVRPANDVHQFGYLLPLVHFIAARDGVFDAMGDVILQDFLPDPPKGGSDCRYLGDDVDTVAVLLDHFREAAHLTLDPAEAFLA